MKSNSTSPDAREFRSIDRSQPRLDAVGKVLGETLYPGDRSYDNQIWMKILFAGRPHARVSSIDTSQAEALSGVVAVLTARDVPVNEYGLQIPDQPVLCGPGSTKEGADVVRFVGDQVALILADSEAIADQARTLIQVEYEDMPIVSDPMKAMEGGAPLLHSGISNNIVDREQVITGDVESAWDMCDVIIEQEYNTPAQEHAYLQPEAGTAYQDEEGRITVRTAGQWAWEDQQQIAHALDLPPDRVRVIYDAIGGAFGGREDMSIQIVLALAAKYLVDRGIDRPVKLIWTRAESIVGHCKRHPMKIWAKWGATSDGILVAADVQLIADAGAYMYTSNKVMANAILSCTGPYEFPNARINSYCVYTNNLPGGAFRGFGGPQGTYAAESQMNKLADALDMDPIEIRSKNLLDDQKPLVFGTSIPGGADIQRVVDETARAGGWPISSEAEPAPGTPPPDTNTGLRAGKGFAVGFKNVGFSFGFQENSWARVVLEGDSQIENASVHIGGADVGQGHHTVMAQIAAEILDIPIENITMIVSDTAVTESSGSASASRLTFMAGNAVKGAAEQAMSRWKDENRPAEASFTYLAPQTTPISERAGDPCIPNFAYGYAAQSVELDVDLDTGIIHIRRVVSTHDVGQAINPRQLTGQVEGCVVQAQGYTILENFQTENGQVLTPNFSTYLIPGVLDIPDSVDTIIVEDPHPEGPFGVRGMAEMPYLTLAPAITAAVHDATGVWFDDFPLTPERVLRGLGKI